MSNIVSPRASFLGLPVELRLKIYENLLLPGDPKKFSHNPNDCWLYPHVPFNKIPLGFGCPCTTQDVSPTILRTSRQVYDEALETLYRDRAIQVFEPTYPLRGWVVDDMCALVPDGARRFIRTVDRTRGGRMGGSRWGPG